MEKREIKFRAWDGKEMHEKVCINHEGNAIKYSYRATDWVDDADAGIPMQFTGLQDKNGKDIYEGDIVRLRCSLFQRFTSQGEEIFKPETWAAAIVWDEFAFCYSHYPEQYDGIRMMSMDEEIEVIGNVFQTPELLTP